ncbi:MAG: bifunctional protein FolC [Francisellaceae bacterium]|nr:bifunctional protein FolC [Francisellaceae bacterium]
MPKSKQEWLSFIEACHPKLIDLGLERIRAVAERLKLIHFNIPVITVAGTNGKGTTVATIESILLNKALKVGAYTSPHLLNYNERIRVNACNITDKDLIAAFSAVDEARKGERLTYFEFGTLSALYHFKVQHLDAIVLEVGLGGRLDAVNIVQNDISVITTIGYDHQSWLGNSLEAIGFEKAGIFKKNNKMAICGEFNPPSTIEQQAQNLGLSLLNMGKDFGFNLKSASWDFWYKNRIISDLPIPQIPLQNAATGVVSILESYPDTQEATIKKALSSLKVPGRIQLVHYQNLSIILDVAHNAPACEWLAEYLRKQYPNTKFHAIFGVLQDKDFPKMINPFKNIVKTWQIIDLDSTRSLDASHIINYLKNDEQVVFHSISLSQTLNSLQEVILENEMILIFGSFYTVAKFFELIN